MARVKTSLVQRWSHRGRKLVIYLHLPFNQKQTRKYHYEQSNTENRAEEKTTQENIVEGDESGGFGSGFDPSDWI